MCIDYNNWEYYLKDNRLLKLYYDIILQTC